MRRSLLLAVGLALVGSAARPEGPTVRGHVSLPGGEPAESIEVRLLPGLSDYEATRLALDGRVSPEPAAAARTLADGSFSLAAPAAGVWALRVEPAGYRPMEYQLEPLLESGRVTPLRLTPEEPVAVRLLDADGAAAAGAFVVASAPAEPERAFLASRSWRPVPRRAFTGADGLAHLARAVGEALHVYAFSPAHLEAERAGIDSGAVSLRLARAELFELEIVDPRGRGVGGALVRLGERRWPVGSSDETGRVLVPLGAGAEGLEILGPGGAWAAHRLDPTTLRPDRPRRLVLPPAVALAGRVIDAETGEALAGAFAWPTGRSGELVRTDASGGFSLAVPPGIDVRVQGAAPGYLGHVTPAPAGAPRGPTLALTQAYRARGVVVDRVGRPIEGASVEAHVDPTHAVNRATYAALAQLERDLTTAEGRFAIGSLHPAMAYSLRAEKPGFAPAQIRLTDPRTDTAGELRIELEAGRRATGTLVGPRGEPVVGGRIEIDSSPRSAGALELQALSLGIGAGEGVESWSDGQGRFAFRDLAPGGYTLMAAAPGYATARGVAAEIPGAAAEADLGEIALERAAPIEGRVTDVAGAPLGGARIFVTSDSELEVFGLYESAPAAESDGGGYFSIGDRAPGERVELRVERPGFADARVVVEAPTPSPIHVELERASRVSGNVVDDRGRPWPAPTCERARAE